MNHSSATQTSSDARRNFFTRAGLAALVTVPLAQSPYALAQSSLAAATKSLATVGTEHWTIKRAGGQDVRLFMWRKVLRDPTAAPRRGRARPRAARRAARCDRDGTRG